MNNNADLVERFAAIAHESWAGWIPWMIDKWNDTHASGETFRDRWLRQASTLYDQLSEAEKESDRTEARKYVAAIAMACPTCGQDMVATVCARCALTTTEERDAARAKVARLTTEVENLSVILRQREKVVSAAREWVWWFADASTSMSPAESGLIAAVAAYYTMTGITDAAT